VDDGSACAPVGLALLPPDQPGSCLIAARLARIASLESIPSEDLSGPLRTQSAALAPLLFAGAANLFPSMNSIVPVAVGAADCAGDRRTEIRYQDTMSLSVEVCYAVDVPAAGGPRKGGLSCADRPAEAGRNEGRRR
jgi:hypothetical protein